MAEFTAKRRRAASLRTQMFNKHMYDMFNGIDQTVELANVSETEGNEDDAMEIEEEDYEEERDDRRTNLFTRVIETLLDNQRIIRTKHGRQIPIALDHDTTEYSQYTYRDSMLLIDERTNRPYIKNRISSSRYTVCSFFTRQIYSQLSKLANTYFLLLMIVIANWPATNFYTVIAPFCVSVGISIAKEAYDVFKRDRMNREENGRYVKVLTKPSRNEHSDSRRFTREAIKFTEFNGKKNNPTRTKLDTRFNNFDLLFEHHGVRIEWKKWEDLTVGDFVLLNQDDWVPADLLLLTTDGNNGKCFIDTMALDGEIDLKIRQPHSKLNKLARAASGLANINAKVTVEDPNINLKNFEGSLVLEYDQNSPGIKYPLTLDNVIFRGSILRNTANTVGMIVFTGEETKVRINGIKNGRFVAPKLQWKINLLVVFMPIVLTAITLISYFAHIINKRQYIGKDIWQFIQQEFETAPKILSFIMTSNAIIPSCFYIGIEIIKIVQTKLMEGDIDMYDQETKKPCEARTATDLEKLGQVSYIFSDKSGTLTENKMLLRKFSVCGTSWIHNVEFNGNVDDVSIFKSRNDFDTALLGKPCHDEDIESKRSLDYGEGNSVKNRGNSAGIYSGRSSIRSLAGKESHDMTCGLNAKRPHNLKSSCDLVKYIQTHPYTVFAEKAKFFILSVALCHSCVPSTCRASSQGNDAVEYQSTSPDELALVKAARDLGYMLSNKNGKILTIRSFPHGFDRDPQMDDYEILETIDFNSDRKRMSVIIKMPNILDKVLLICKGADSVILQRLSNYEIMHQKLGEFHAAAKKRKDAEAEVVMQQKKSLQLLVDDDANRSLFSYLSSDVKVGLSLTSLEESKSKKKKRSVCYPIGSMDKFLGVIEYTEEEVDDIILDSRKALWQQQSTRNGHIPSPIPSKHQPIDAETFEKQQLDAADSETEMLHYIGNEQIITDEEYLVEKTLQAIDEFSNEGLRTFLYGYKWVNMPEYMKWKGRYHAAVDSISNPGRTLDIIAEAEANLKLLGATAIEDKLQDGVAESIEKIKRAGIIVWMLTGDKMETAINVGYACKLIYDYTTLIILRRDDEDIISKMSIITQELDCGNIAHCVVVIDGATLTVFENNCIFMSVFLELATKTNSVICCRTSPAQKSMLVAKVKSFNRDLVTLAIGDGANDVAMMQSADIGVAIIGKEVHQASNSSDYSIAQFRFLDKMLLVHGRYNYLRISKFLLCTFYKELAFYVTQIIFQRYTIFAGSTIYDLSSWPIYNALLFMSLTVLCIGMFEKDLRPMTLLMVPELYSAGQLRQALSLAPISRWVILGTLNSFLVSLLFSFLNVVTWGETVSS